MNSNSRYKLVESLYQRAVDLPRDCREAFLVAECGGDDELREELATLLTHYEKAGEDFLAQPAHPFSGPDGSPPVPRQIGSFEVVRLIGEGGMGAVYEARQKNPVRHVAVKVIRTGVSSRMSLKRFANEAQILGRLQHPGIAHIYEAGVADVVTPNVPNVHQPYFAMELIRGEPLDKHVLGQRLDSAQRLDLFARICDAVAHAHQAGVIHRDLKPANILITNDGKPKVLDFGVARVTDSDVQMTTMQTDVAQVVGTLPYMSPEQVKGLPEELDVRSDVYALAVILYELVTGQLPYDLTDMPIARAARIIAEDAPATVSSINRSLRGDLETVVHKGLDKEPDRRYQTVEALAADVRRYLDREPIAARPPSAAYQFRKFAQRNKALVGGVIATFVALVLGIIGTGYALLEITAQRNEAKLQASIVEAVNTFLAEDLLSQADPQIESDREILLHVALDRAAQGIEGKFENAPLVEASIRRTIGKTYDNLGRYPSARPHLVRALDLFRGELGDWHEDTNQCRADLGMLLMNVGEYDPAEKMFLDMLAAQRTELGEFHRDTIASLQNLGAIYLVQGRYDQAEPILLETRDAIRHSDNVDDGELAITLNNLGSVYIYTGRLAEAEALLTEGLGLQKRVHGEEHPHTLQAMAGLGTLYANQQRYDEAVAMLSEAMKLQRRVLGEEHRNTLQTAGVLAAMYGIQGDTPRKRDLLREILEVQGRILGEEHLDTLVTRLSLADVAFEEKRKDDALTSYRSVAESFARAFPDHYLTGMAYQRLGRCLIAHEQFEEAERSLLQAHRLLLAVLGKTHERTRVAVSTLVDLYRAWDRPDQAAEWEANASVADK